ncbi:MAG: peptidylprolyl isomerase [Pseudohongiella sp.]|uniref:peptidylprolyl isomerase n=1 Tax=Pseudohongiella sp. TaxID=1979412 RepID=UPI00349FD627
MSFLPNLKKAVLTGGMLTALFATVTVQANTLVRVNTTYGSFTIELFDEAAPDTVSNFLGYVDRGDYARSLFHRSESDFVVQAGAYQWQRDCATGMDATTCSAIAIPSQGSVRNEPGASNTRGTLAMAKFGGAPDSATSQWFVNLADNTDLDEQNGGFTVFGKVLGEGLAVADAINDLPVINVGGEAQQLPVRDFDTQQNQLPAEANLVLINMHRVERFSSAVNVFEYGTALLTTSVDAGDLGNLSLNMRLVSDGPELVFEMDPTSIVPLSVAPDGRGVFDEAEQRLRLPQVELNDNGQVSVINNVVLRMTDGAQLRFVVESYEE